jgi:hydroxymethylglutaryl-CoA lyase
MKMNFVNNVTIREVGLRDGLQNEKEFVKTADKLKLFEMLAGAGIKDIEITSFVNPKAVPQLSDAEDLLSMLPPTPDVKLSAVIANIRGVERALKTNISPRVVGK